MKKRRHTPEQVIRKQAEGEKLLAQDRPCRGLSHLEITGVDVASVAEPVRRHEGRRTPSG